MIVPNNDTLILKALKHEAVGIIGQSIPDQPNTVRGGHFFGSKRAKNVAV
jgi:hypothetical protein